MSLNRIALWNFRQISLKVIQQEEANPSSWSLNVDVMAESPAAILGYVRMTHRQNLVFAEQGIMTATHNCLKIF